ncbi:NUDIX domain-containing protein [Streptomyces rugosispiralis]|uniref:NUDIX domain-containing protein n=1 Tax=Streptomyces rugosispiralis TaxID=2967341 RepID=A0ABT1VET4_9ACTN|nr:NUDIX domain-containing protein [Streptomyces rugosispiralis]MCQ8195523.1 NUDIX domain-containing protein [Streptomyces rugosispiralis]
MKKRIGAYPGVRTEDGGRGVVSQASQGARSLNESGRPTSRVPRQVVAVILMWRGRIGLFKRSGSVQHDAGLWHCITGYLDADSDPVRQAIQEIWEETLLPARALEQLTAGPTLRLADPRGGPDWTVHTFMACTGQRRLTLNWEHKAYRWVRPRKLAQFDGQVAWLTDVLRAVEALPSAKACDGAAS